MTKHHARYLGMFVCLLLMLGCEKAPEPQKIGVFVSSDRGLLELTAYGEQNGMTSYSFHQLTGIPTVGKVNLFYVNMPDSKITESKVYWLTKLDRDFHEDGQQQLNLSIETGKNNVYRITCADLGAKKGGYALLKVSMPLGTPDRMYLTQMSE